MKSGKHEGGARLGKLAIVSAAIVLAATPAFANVKHLEINADMDSINEPAAGNCFIPELLLSDEDEERITLIKPDAIDMAKNNPTVPTTVNVVIYSDEEELDDDLTISGTGLKSTYVDFVSVDNTEAHARLQIYPFFELIAPTPVMSGDTVSWGPIAYASKYEVVITVNKKNGETKNYHRVTSATSLNLASYKSGAESVGVAVRALPTTETGYEVADISQGIASWDPIDGASDYRLTIKYTDTTGKTHKEMKTVKGSSSLSVQAYINSAAAGTLQILVRGIPGGNQSIYYNIAMSDFGTVGNADTSDYEVDDKWEFLADYTATVDGYMAGSASASTSLGKATGTSDGYWQREAYRFKYLVNGVPYTAGWKQISGKWYYFAADGFMQTGWVQDQGKWYYLETKIGDKTGTMLVSESRAINGVNYTFDATGACINK